MTLGKVPTWHPLASNKIKPKSKIIYFWCFRIRWLREIGLIQRTVKRWMEDKPKCESSAADFSSVGIQEILPLFMFYTYGILFSAFLGIGEILVHPKGFLRKYFAKKKNVNTELGVSEVDNGNDEKQSNFVDWEFVN